MSNIRTDIYLRCGKTGVHLEEKVCLRTNRELRVGLVGPITGNGFQLTTV